MREAVLFGVFLGLHKLYNALDRDRCLVILAVYGVGPRTIRLLWTYWGRLTMLARAVGYSGLPFKGYRSVNQRKPLSPMIFNVVLESAIRPGVAVVAPTKDGTEGLGLSIQDLEAYLYARDRLVASIHPKRLQRVFDILSGFFYQDGLRLVIMACQPFHAPGQMSLEAYDWRTTGTGPTFRERQQRRVACPECRVEVTTGSLMMHRQIQHNVVRGGRGEPPPPPASPGEAQNYRVYLPKRLLQIRCPVEGCLGGAFNKKNLQVHFAHHHAWEKYLSWGKGTDTAPDAPSVTSLCHTSPSTAENDNGLLKMGR